MSKLFKLKQWLTVPDAAKHLSLDLEEEVTEADVLRLALDGHLPLSVRFVGHVAAYEATIIPLSEAPTTLGLEGETVYFGRIDDNSALKFDDTRTILTGIFDLPFLGGERLDVEQRYQELTNGLPVELVCIDGTFVRGAGDRLFQLQSHLGEDSYPAVSLPEDAVLVVWTNALRAFEQSIADSGKGIDRPVGTKERRTRLVVMAALCNLARIKPGDHGAATHVARATDRLGAPVSADTISQIFREIPEALEWRKK